MLAESYKYLHFIPYFQLTNWSVQHLLENNFAYSDKYELVEIEIFLARNKTGIDIKDEEKYKRVTVKTNNGGIFLRDIEKGSNIGTKRQYIISEGQFLLSKIDARNGAFGVVPKELDNGIITGNFWAFDVNNSIINPHFLSLVTTTQKFINFSEAASSGTTNRHYLQEKLFLSQKIPLPSLSEQQRLVDNYNASIRHAEMMRQQAKVLETDVENYLYKALGIEKSKNQKWENGKLYFMNFSSVQEWGIDGIIDNNKYSSSKYNLQSFSTNSKLAIEIFRGKSPKYAPQSKSIVINQKCNRWNEIDLNHAKTVDIDWLNTIDRVLFTKEGDILINSTGEGTLGRASTITSYYTNLLYDSHVLLLRVNKELMYPDFFTFVLNSFYGQQQVNSLKSAQSTNQTELGIENLKKILFPVPPLPIQQKIVNHIRSMKEQIKNLRQRAEEYKKKAIIEFEKEIFK
jgi:restriction endonuclease S subunit